MVNKPIRLIATDIDGTLLNTRHELTPRTEQALRRAMQQGVEVVLATGKTYFSGAGIIRQLGLTSPGVYVQGLVITGPEGEVLRSQTLEPEVVRHVTAFTEAEKRLLLGYTGARIVMSEENTFADALVAYHEPRPEVVGPLSLISGSTQFNKLIVTCEPEEMALLRQKLSRHIDGSATLVRSAPALLEILPVGASKGAGLAWLLERLGVPQTEVLAIGDAENDIEMLRMAGIGVAVGNAMQAVKEAADVIVAGNDEDGVAEAVERFVLR
jgi:Cof subfamily protein (haloacid dehalogenase superfamily)